MPEQDEILQSDVVQKHVGKLQADYDKKIAELQKQLGGQTVDPEAAKVLAGATEEFNKIKKELDESKQKESLVVAAQEFYTKFEQFGVKLSELLKKSSAKDMLDYCAEQTAEYEKQREDEKTKVVHAGVGSSGASLPNITPHEALQVWQKEASERFKEGKATEVVVNPFR